MPQLVPLPRPEAGRRQISVVEALALLWPAGTRLAPVERTLPEASGCVLAESIESPGPMPRQATALRTGWAVASADLAGASSYGPVFLEGPSPVAVGEILPGHADAVLPFDAAALSGGLLEAGESIEPGDGVRRLGEDFRQGFVLCEAGKVLTGRPLAASLLAGIAICRVRVPRIKILAEKSSPIASFMTNWLLQTGAQVATGDPEASGGDLVIALGNALPDGATPETIAMRPAEGITCGRVDGVPLLALPERLDAALGALLLLVEPCLRAMTGALAPPAGRAGRLSRKIASRIGLTELILLRDTGAGFEPLAVGDASLAAVLRADGWLAVPPGSEGMAPGETVAAFDLRRGYLL